jgi:hypothetical protein
LQLRNQLVALANNILVLLVFVVRSVRLDDTLAVDAVDGAWNPAAGNELGQVTGNEKGKSICLAACP